MGGRCFVVIVGMLLAGLFACGSSNSGPEPLAPLDPAIVESSVRANLDELARFGSKRAGTEENRRAGDYVLRRFREAKLTDVHFETFRFPQFVRESSSLAITVDGVTLPMAHEVFAYSGVGQVDGTIVDLGKGHEEDYAGKDVHGKAVLVRRDPFFHRQSQAALVNAHGGAAMLYVSAAPDNLIQIGTVNDAEDGLGPIPALTIGAADGAKIAGAIAEGKSVRSVMEVRASIAGATGRNVVGRISGTDPSGAYLLLGAHYDTWYDGALDNGTGVSALLRMAEDLATRGPRRLSIVFVAYDAEELGLFGGYDYLRKHVVIGNEPMLAFMNFEIPSNAHDGATATAKTSGPIAKVIEETEVPVLYALNAGLDAVAPLFGGLIPTDIQGMYWYGLQGLSTACESPYYHTTADTPDKLDTGFLAQVTIAFEGLVAAVDSQPLASFAVRDPKLWRAAVRMEPDAASGGLGVEVAVADDGGAPQAGARVAVWLDVDDFSRAHRVSVTADSDGRARVVIPSGALAVGEGGRFVHVTAGRAFPLVEWIGAVR